MICRTLSSSALDALKQFYAERDAHTEKFAKLQAAAQEKERLAAEEQAQPLSMELFTEDWGKSQFWYKDETANLYARQLLEGATEDMTIAIVSTPSVFVALKNILNAADASQPRPKIFLLEHDNRFAVFPEFVFYDYTQPMKLPASMKGSVSRLMIDPPFLDEDCQTKFALTARWLALPPTASPAPRFIISTGERCKAMIDKLYRAYSVRPTDYELLHRGGLSNEFYCYTNFEVPGVWKYLEDA